jgi:hypothetical protein
VVDTVVTDAYHSLSIEGYRVSTALLERVRTGAWDPENIVEDREQRNAFAARGSGARGSRRSWVIHQPAELLRQQI